MRISRNAPCPCGSGLKYKRCCSEMDSPGIADGPAGGAPEPGPLLTDEMIRQARREKVWEVDVVPMPIALESEPWARPAMLAVVAGRLALHHDLVSKPPREIRELAFMVALAVRRAAERVGGLPEELHVRHDDLADILNGRFRQEGVHVIHTPYLFHIDDLMMAMTEKLGAPPGERPVMALPDRWAGWDLEPAEARQLFDAIREFHGATPWERLSPLELLGFTLPDGERWYGQVFPGEAGPGGLILYRDLDDALYIIDSADEWDSATTDLVDRFYTLSLQEKEGLPRGMADEIASHGWPIGGPDGYPRLTSSNSPGGAIRRSDVQVLASVLRALAAFHRAGTPGIEEHWLLDSHLEHPEAERAWDDLEGSWIHPDPIWTDPATGVAISFYGFIGAEVAAFGMAGSELDEHWDGFPDFDLEPDPGLDDLAGLGPDAELEPWQQQLHDELRTQLEALVEGEGELKPERLGELSESLIGSINARPMDDLGGLTPARVHALLSQDWEGDPGPLQFDDTLQSADLRGSKLLRDAQLFLRVLEEEGGTRATQAGNLNRAFVERMRAEGDWGGDWWAIPDDDRKVVNEQDIPALHELRVLLELASLIRKRKGTFVVMRSARKWLEEERAGELFGHLFRTQFGLMNLGYGDGFAGEGELEYGMPYTLVRLGTVAREWARPDDLAPLVLLTPVRDVLRRDPWIEEGVVLGHRVLRRLERFGLMEARPDRHRPHSRSAASFRVTPLFDRFIRVRFDAPGYPGGPGH